MSEYSLWSKYYKLNNYYHRSNLELLKKLIEKDASVIEFGTRNGEILKKLASKKKIGVNFSKTFKERNNIIHIENINKIKEKYDYVVLNHALSEAEDIQLLLKKINNLIHEDSNVIVISFNYLWKPLADLAEYFGIKYPYPENPNWLDSQDISNFFSLEDFMQITASNQVLIPFYIPYISDFINKYLAPLPLINKLCLTKTFVFKPRRNKKEYSVSIVIPARNEEGNITGVLSKIPKLGKSTEDIFVEGNSSDNTWQAIEKEIKTNRTTIKTSLLKQTGKGKGNAVRIGFDKAKGEILMILDADLTVRPNELSKFYNAISEGHGDFIMGSRFVYPMENQAMRTLNYFGNRIFSLLFSYLLDQTVKDTLCGTKVLFKKHYEKIVKGRSYFGEFDPFGDYDLIFGAKKLNLKIVEIPVRYRDRIYGKTNISRFTHGFLLLKMSLIAAKKLKFN